MKISFIKYNKDNQNYKLAKSLGFEVFEIDNPELIDSKIEELKNKQYTTIFIPDELASFSENVIRKYQYDLQIKIVITPNK